MSKKRKTIKMKVPSSFSKRFRNIRIRKDSSGSRTVIVNKKGAFTSHLLESKERKAKKKLKSVSNLSSADCNRFKRIINYIG